MSTLEKTIGLLQTLPEYKVNAVYAFIRLLDSKEFKDVKELTAKEDAIQAMFGSAHEYANLSLISQEEGAFERAMVEKHAANRY
jgi:hypothetical protein